MNRGKTIKIILGNSILFNELELISYTDEQLNTVLKSLFLELRVKLQTRHSKK